MFKAHKINYAIIGIGSLMVEGECTYWEFITVGTETYVKAIINKKPYIVGINNIVLTEN